MNKRIFQIGLMILAVTFIFTACSDDPLIKSEIDALYAVEDPSLTIVDPLNVTAKGADLSATVSNLDVVNEIGFIRSTNENFENSQATPVDVAGSTSISTTVGLVPLTQYFVKAYAITKSGNTVFSETVSFSTPDAPFIEKITGVYKATLTSFFEGNYNSTITIKPHDEEGKLIIENLEPYFASYGYTADEGYNIYEATYDEETGTINVPGFQSTGYTGVSFVCSTSEDYSLDLMVKDNGATLSVADDAMWGAYTDAGWYELYLGGYNYIKQ